MERFLANTHAVVVTACEYMDFMRLCQQYGCRWNSGQSPIEFIPGGVEQNDPLKKYTIFFRKDNSAGMMFEYGDRRLENRQYITYQELVGAIDAAPISAAELMNAIMMEGYNG